MSACSKAAEVPLPPAVNLMWEQRSLGAAWALRADGADTGWRVAQQPHAEAFAEVVNLNTGQRAPCRDLAACKAMAETAYLARP